MLKYHTVYYQNTSGSTSSLDLPFDWDWVPREVCENLKNKIRIFFLEKDTLPQLVRNQDTGTCHYSKQLKSSLRSGNLAWQRVPSSWPDCPSLLFIFFQSIWLGVWWKPSQTSFLLCRLINSRAHSHPKSEKQHKKVGLSICLIRLPTFRETSYRHVSGKDTLISWNRRNKCRKETNENLSALSFRFCSSDFPVPTDLCKVDAVPNLRTRWSHWMSSKLSIKWVNI